MGSTKNYLPSGGFKQREYQQVAVIGSVKVIEKVDGGKVNLPLYSNTPNSIYAILGEDGEVKQIAVYGTNRLKIKDIDWSHKHKNPSENGTVFEKGEIHVQEYDEHGRRKSQNARKPSPEEIRLVMTAKKWRKKK